MTNFPEKVALITGGSRGIGAGIARRLAQDGINVAFTYRDHSKAAQAVLTDIEHYQKKGIAIQVDAANALEIKPVIDQVMEQFGRIDILVNNAGYMDTSGAMLPDIPLEVIDRTIMVNIRAAFLFAQNASIYLKNGGRIINIGSCLAGRVPGPGLTLYSMSKSAITGLTKGLARDLAERGITVNQISPGPIDTDMNPATGPSADFQRSLAALGRYGAPADIAAAVSFLASQDASFITGADITVDGGTNI
jgi:3-oxoacyl-[acyl-carrier protein] reductase